MTSIPRGGEANLVDEPGLTHAFRVVLVALLTSSLAVSTFTLFLGWPLIPQLTLVAAASCVVALVLSRSGRLRPAMLFALLGIAYVILHAAVRFDGMQSIGLAILPFLIVLCALLLTRLMIVFFTAAVVLAVFGMLATRYFVLRVERYSTNDMGDLFIFALTCATAALVGRLLAVRIDQALGLVRNSESRYRRIFENVQDVYYEMRTDGTLLELSPTSVTLFGVPREAMIGRPLAPFCVNESELDALLAAVHLHGRVSNRELVIRHSRAGPHYVLVNASLHTGLQLGEERVIGSIRDITETKLAEQARRESERRFRELLEGVPLVAIMTDLDGTISFCNDYTLAITGWSKEEVIGRPAKDLLNPQGPPQVTDEMAIAPPGGRTQPFFEGSILEKDGGRRWIQWCCTPLRDSAGRAAGFASLGEDVTELRILRAEVTRRESEVRFQSMANTAPVMIWVAGADKLCTFFNKGWLDFTGRSMEQELGNGWASGVHPEDLDRCLATYSSSFDARRTLQMEYRLRRADGEYRWVLDNALPLYREGEFAGYIGSCIDVTEQKLIEERLRASEARLMDAQRLAKVGSWERDIEADRIQWSDEILRILGLSSVAPSNFPAFLSYVHPNDREKILETDAKARSSTAPVDIEYRIIQPDGEMRFVRSIVEAIRNNQGAPVRIVGATQDITEQVKARELLRASEERLKNAERLAHVGNWHWDIPANRITWSEEMFRIFGKPQDYTPNYDGFFQGLIPQDRERVERAIRDALAGKGETSLDFQITLPDGDVRTVATIAEVLESEEGLPTRVFGACQDITDQRRAEAELLRNLDQIAHLNRVAAMGELTASIAHELNQPLAAILSNAQAASRFLSGESPDLAQVRDCLVDIVADDKRAGEVIKRVRALLKKGELQASLVDLNDVAGEVIRLTRNDALLQHTLVIFEPLMSLPPVLGDRVQLYQVVLNLILNGLEAAVERPVGNRWLLVRTSEADGGGVQLTVVDSGGGIAESDLARVFEPFFSTKREGLGVGLSISRSIVHAHGGRLWAENSANGGAIFRCILPVAQQAAAAPAS